MAIFLDDGESLNLPKTPDFWNSSTIDKNKHPSYIAIKKVKKKNENKEQENELLSFGNARSKNKNTEFFYKSNYLYTPKNNLFKIFGESFNNRYGSRKKNLFTLYFIPVLRRLTHLLLFTTVELSIMEFSIFKNKEYRDITLLLLNIINIISVIIDNRDNNFPLLIDGLLMAIRSIFYFILYTTPAENQEGEKIIKHIGFLLNTIYLLIFNFGLWTENDHPLNFNNIYRLIITELATISFFYFYYEMGIKKINNWDELDPLKLQLSILFMNGIFAQLFSNIAYLNTAHHLITYSIVFLGIVTLSLYLGINIQSSVTQWRNNNNPNFILLSKFNSNIRSNILIYNYFFLLDGVVPKASHNFFTEFKRLINIQIPTVLDFFLYENILNNTNTTIQKINNLRKGTYILITIMLMYKNKNIYSQLANGGALFFEILNLWDEMRLHFNNDYINNLYKLNNKIGITINVGKNIFNGVKYIELIIPYI